MTKRQRTYEHRAFQIGGILPELASPICVRNFECPTAGLGHETDLTIVERIREKCQERSFNSPARSSIGGQPLLGFPVAANQPGGYVCLLIILG